MLNFLKSLMRKWASPASQPKEEKRESERDQSDHKLTTERLRQSEERFQVLIDSIQDYAIYILDPSGFVVSWNTGAQRIKGYTAKEIVGKHFSRFYHTR